MVALFSLASAAIAAFVATYLAYWKFGRDERSARIDDVCSTVRDLAELAIDYWATDYQDSPRKREMAEARILAQVTLVDGLMDAIRPGLLRADLSKTEQCITALWDVATGGRFSESERLPDPERVRGSALAASELIVQMRVSHRNALPLQRSAAWIRAMWRDAGRKASRLRRCLLIAVARLRRNCRRSDARWCRIMRRLFRW